MNTDDSQKAEFCRLLNAYQAANEHDDVQAMELLVAQMFSIASEEAARNPTERLRLMQEAHEHEDAARWEQAEAVHRRILVLAEVEGNEGKIFKAHDDLRSLFAIRGMADEALQEAQAALEAARKTDMVTLLLVALRGLSQCHSRGSRPGCAC